ncbi:MAG: hypothetical protein H7122_09425 [Chitinophagaceae bacterium]|nr:hypothetical protein [Chitinophagaceae bacterium]
MPVFIQYLIKLSICLSLVWIFYQLILRRLTFYNWNRWFLLGYSLLSFIIPFIDISPALEKVALVDNRIIQSIPVMQLFATANENFSMDQWDWAFIFFITGCIILSLRLTIQHLSFLRLRRTAKLLFETPVKLYQVDREIIPFSFGDAIFINQHHHTGEDLKEIIRHEFVHVRQKHSVDMLLAEWICILNWYNPFSWLIRNAIRQNLEFIADSKVIQNGIDKKHYQYLLLKVMGVPQYNIATNFNFTSLKKRIAMMNKIRSARVNLVKFLFILPIIALVLLSFRNRLTHNAKPAPIARKSQIQDTIPRRPGVPAKAPFPKNVSGFSSINNEVTVTLKDGTKEKYNLNKPEEKAAFETKYGSLPAPPEPPSSVLAPPPPSPAGSSLPENVSGIHINDQKATIKLKNGKIETYDLRKSEEKEAFEKKYGDLKPPAPVAPAISLSPVTASAVTITKVEPVVSVDVVAPVISIPSVTASVSADLIDVEPVLQPISPVEEIEEILEISNRTTSEQLTLIKKQLFMKGYKLEIGNVHFKDGSLQSIEGTIADENSKSRFVADDFSKLIILKTKYKSNKSGFMIRVVSGTIRL